MLLTSFVSMDAMKNIPYLRSALASLSDIAVMLLLISLVQRQSLSELLAITGLRGPWSPAFIWIVLVIAPAGLVCLLAAKFSPDLSVPALAWLGIGGPIAEEIVYRGLAIGVLMQLCGWKFLPACLLPALFFGFAHFSQGSDLESTLGIVAITGAGGLLFGWLFVRWGYNLAPPLLLHVAMNSLFVLFDLGDNAIGSWLLNGLRIAIVAIAIGATLKFAPTRNIGASSS
ncbi:MAG: CPBP family intramembrane glutamic endopeptidase [Parasphingorhabdus sp.]|uniref:CPBP family intramembrane glutamic endopeptidase n=2 Tax=Parasphingorhabdus sp. TaxID=2709688 RepID=UPI0032643BE3